MAKGKGSNTLIIEDYMEVPYPEEELQELRKYMELRGFVKMAHKNTGISESIIREFRTNGTGQFGIVTKLRQFVTQFKVEVA